MNVFLRFVPMAAIAAIWISPSTVTAEPDEGGLEDAPAWVGNCAGELKARGETGICGTGVTNSTPDSFFCESDAKQRARDNVATKVGSLVFKAIDKSKCWAGELAPTVAVIKVSESAISVAAQWKSKNQRCAAMLKMDLAGFQKTVFKTCGMPDGKDAEIYQVAREVWESHFASGR